jgi:cytochrome bd ubiquinol oxidase subunit II
VLAVVGLPLAAATARPLFDGLTGRALPAVLLAGVAFAVALVAMLRARDVLARDALVVAVAGLVWGWGLAQFPRLVGRNVTVANAAAAPAELHAVAITLLAGAVLLAPSLWFLHRAFRGRSPEALR